MIIWGIRKKILSGSSTEEIQCPECKNRYFNKFGVMRYFHIFWIPLFIFSKRTGLECSQCQRIIKSRELSAEMKKDIKFEVFTLGQILKGNFGLVLFLTVLFLFSVYVFLV